MCGPLTSGRQNAIGQSTQINIVTCKNSEFMAGSPLTMSIPRPRWQLNASKLPSKDIIIEMWDERRATTLIHLFLFALLLTQSGDVEKNPGPIETIETVYS